MFSIGVILFIIVQGIFPFKEARKEEYFYNLLLEGRHDTYFQKVNGTGLSQDFKDLILKFFSYNGNERPTIEQLKAHPWLNSPTFDYEATRMSLLTKLAQKQASQQKPAEEMTKPVRVRKSAAMVWTLSSHNRLWDGPKIHWITDFTSLLQFPYQAISRHRV